jgi:hypothetical protein
MKVSLLILGSFELLAPKPEVAQQLAKGAKEKSQTRATRNTANARIKDDEMPRPL